MLNSLLNGTRCDSSVNYSWNTEYTSWVFLPILHSPESLWILDNSPAPFSAHHLSGPGYRPNIQIFKYIWTSVAPWRSLEQEGFYQCPQIYSSMYKALYPSRTTVKRGRGRRRTLYYCYCDTTISDLPHLLQWFHKLEKMWVLVEGLKDSKKAQYRGSCYFHFKLPAYFQKK